MLIKTLSNVINYILPFRCIACSEFTEEDSSLCSKCFNQFNFVAAPYCLTCGFPFDFEIEEQYECGKCIATPPNYELARSLFKFDLNSKKIIHRFKYNDQTGSAKLFSKLLFSRYKQDFEDIDFICPVPMNRFKRIYRNYNPPQILGKHLAKALDTKQIPDLLIKSKWTKPQASLSQAERMLNLKGSIISNKKYDITNKVILLVDDVRTTGVTSNNCSAILKKAGAKKVKLITIATT